MGHPKSGEAPPAQPEGALECFCIHVYNHGSKTHGHCSASTSTATTRSTLTMVKILMLHLQPPNRANLPPPSPPLRQPHPPTLLPSDPHSRRLPSSFTHTRSRRASEYQRQSGTPPGSSPHLLPTPDPSLLPPPRRYRPEPIPRRSLCPPHVGRWAHRIQPEQQPCSPV